MNARSALETGLILVLSAGLGFAVCWFYRDKTDLKEANTSLAKDITAIKDAAPEIAKQVASLQRSAQTTRSLNEAFAAQNERLAPLADCVVPDELWRLSIQRAEAINANARSDQGDSDQDRLPEGGRH